MTLFPRILSHRNVGLDYGTVRLMRISHETSHSSALTCLFSLESDSAGYLERNYSPLHSNSAELPRIITLTPHSAGILPTPKTSQFGSTRLATGNALHNDSTVILMT